MSKDGRGVGIGTGRFSRPVPLQETLRYSLEILFDAAAKLYNKSPLSTLELAYGVNGKGKPNDTAGSHLTY